MTASRTRMMNSPLLLWSLLAAIIAGVDASYMSIDYITGDPSLGDCYTVEQMVMGDFPDATTGCIPNQLTYTYYNGGQDENGEATGYPKETYLTVNVDIVHSCDDPVANPDTCDITVVGRAGHCRCIFDEITQSAMMVDCVDGLDVFPANSNTPQIVDLFTDGADNIPYDEAFLTLDFDAAKCDHPAVADAAARSIVPSIAPSMQESVIPSIVPSIIPSTEDSIIPSIYPSYEESIIPSIIPSIFPSYEGSDTMIPSIWPSTEESILPSDEETFVPSPENSWVSALNDEFELSYAEEDVFLGDPDQGACYHIGWSLSRVPDFATGCITHDLVYTYYNGGIDVHGKDSGFPEVLYATIRVQIVHECDDPSSDLIDVSIDGVGSCDGNSRYSFGVLWIDGCKNLGLDILPAGSQTIYLFGNEFGGGAISSGSNGRLFDYNDDYLLLSYDPARCDHPAYDQAAFDDPIPMATKMPSLKPTSVPVISHSPSHDRGDGLMFAVEDEVSGDPTKGECYTVERSIAEGARDDETGCLYTQLDYTYTNGGGVDMDGFDAGFPREVYTKVEVDVTHQCENGDRDVCAIMVDGVGTCKACSYALGKVTMLDCSNLESQFPFGAIQKIGFFASSVGNRIAQLVQEEFFTLAYREEWCDVHSITPSAVPFSDMPSQGGPTYIPWSSFSESPSGEAPSGIPFSDMPTKDAPSTIPWSSFSESPSGEAPSGIPFSGAPSQSDPPSFVDTFDMDGEIGSALSCMDSWASGVAEEGKCYAVDVGMCMEIWGNGCTKNTALYNYYTQSMSLVGVGAEVQTSQETHLYVEVTATYGCGPVTTTPGRPLDGCTISIGGVECNECVNDGTDVEMVDCTNLAGTFKPPQNQVISLLEGGGSFDVVEKDDVCDSDLDDITATDSSDSDRGTDLDDLEDPDDPENADDPDDTDDTDDTDDLDDNEDPEDQLSDKPTKTLQVKLFVHFTFFPTRGSKPKTGTIVSLVANTIDFFHTEFLSDTAGIDVPVLDVRMEDIGITYLAETSPDEYDMEMKAVIEIPASSSLTSRKAGKLMADSDLSEYIRDYVKLNPTGETNALHWVKAVSLRAISH